MKKMEKMNQNPRNLVASSIHERKIKVVIVNLTHTTKIKIKTLPKPKISQTRKKINQKPSNVTPAKKQVNLGI